MKDPARSALETRVLLLAPTGRDASLIETVLLKAGIASTPTADMDSLCRMLVSGAGAVLLAEESIADRTRERLIALLKQQPPWSDLPLLLLTDQGADSLVVLQALEDLGNVTLLERPIRVAALISAVRFALRARQRQYQIRSYLGDVQEAAKTSTRLAAIVESSDDAILSKTLEGIITSWNAGAEQLFEYSAEEAIGRSIMLIVPPERADEEQRILSQLRRGLRVQHFETERVAKSGRKVDVSVSVSPIRDESGQVVGASKVARDIGVRKRADAALKEADRRKDEFLATLAHELRNPLAPIRSSLQALALGRSLGPALEIMNRQVDHMVRLIDDLLEVSRITRGKIELRRERVSIGSVLESAVETSRPLIDAAGHDLVVTNSSHEVWLDADPVRLSQIFANLLNNAAKYTDEGGTIEISVRVEPPRVVVTVRDTGIGIAPETLPHVFEMFSQASRTERRAQDGLGIGLSLVRTLVEMHGGKVEARSAGVGRGSEFVVSLPVAAEARAESSHAESPTKSEPSARDFSAWSILVVDDNRDAADSLGMVMRSLGAQVEIGYDGPSALHLLDAGAFDLALLDIGMPGMDGYELARRIRSQPRHRGVALVALTGWGQDEDRRRAIEAGFDHHVGKPATVKDLRALLVSLRPER